MEVKIILRSVLIIIILLLQLGIKARAQESEKEVTSRQKFGLEYKSYAIGKGTEKGLFRKGFNAFYSWQILGNNKHQISVSPQIGFVFDPGIQTRLLQTFAVDYNVNFTRRLEMGAFFALSHVLTKLDFDRYEYNKNGDFKNEGKFRRQFSPSYGGRIGWKLIKNANFSISPYVGLSFIKLDRSYNGTIKGFKGTGAVGLSFNF